MIFFRIFIIETKLDFVSLRPRKFVAERDFPILNSYTGQVFKMSESQQGPEICDVISGKRYSCYVGLGFGVMVLSKCN